MPALHRGPDRAFSGRLAGELTAATTAALLTFDEVMDRLPASPYGGAQAKFRCHRTPTSQPPWAKGDRRWSRGGLSGGRADIQWTWWAPAGPKWYQAAPLAAIPWRCTAGNQNPRTAQAIPAPYERLDTITQRLCAASLAPGKGSLGCPISGAHMQRHVRLPSYWWMARCATSRGQRRRNPPNRPACHAPCLERGVYLGPQRLRKRASTSGPQRTPTSTPKPPPALQGPAFAAIA